MNTIHKFQLNIIDEQTIDLPRNAKFLSVQEQFGVVCTWVALDDADMEKQPCPVKLRGTGHPLGEDLAGFGFLGTVQQHGFVWHVFVPRGCTV